MSKISELTDGGSLLPTDFLIAVRSGGNVKVQADDITVDQIRLGDNEKIELGNSQDLQIYHDGSNSYITDAGTGNLNIIANEFALYEGNGTDLMIGATPNGAVTLSHDATTKLATTATGIDVTGTAVTDGVTVAGNILLSSEGNELQFNTSSTPVNKIYADDTYTSNGLTISADNGVALKSTNNYLLLDDTGTNEMVLNVDGGERMRVTSTGIDVTGSVTADGLTVDTAIATSSASFRATSNSTTVGQKIGSLDFFNGTTNAAGTLEVRRASGGNAYSDMALMASANGNRSNQLLLSTNGDISFYDDAAAQGLFWDSSASMLGLGTTIPGQKLEIKESSAGAGDAIIRLRGNGNNAENTPLGSLEWFNTDSSGPQPGVVAAVEAQSANANGHMGKLLFKTHDGSGSEADPPTTRMTIDESGNVGIGTTSPDTLLHLSGDATSIIRLENTNAGLALNSVIGSIEFEKQDGSGAGAGVAGSMKLITSNNNGAESSLVFSTCSTARGNNAEAMRIDANGNVGIGTDSPVTDLDVRNNISMGDGTSVTNLSMTRNSANYISASDAAGYLVFRTGSSVERVRIDASGNLLVGKTSANNTTQGVTFYGAAAPGAASFVRDSGNTLVLNRLTTDGEIVAFRKDGASVGSIGTVNGDMYLGTGDTGLFFSDGADYIMPYNVSTPGLADGLLDLGRDTNRFKDLYLSGGAYLGGTAAANKLDDYETGTFTPTVAGDATGVFGAAEGYYTKVGRLVFIELYFTVGTNFTSNTVGGLPFTVANLATGTSYGQSAVVLTSAADTVTGAAQEATTNATFYNDHNILSAHAPNTTNSAYRLSMCYQST